jgi:DNA-directed RNA polymerase specialized sigma24 family protein
MCVACTKLKRAGEGKDPEKYRQQKRERLSQENASAHFERAVGWAIPWASKIVPAGWTEDFTQDIHEKLLRGKVFACAFTAAQGSVDRFRGYIIHAVHRHAINWFRTYQRRYADEVPTDPKNLDRVDPRTVDTEGRAFWCDFQRHFPEVAHYAAESETFYRARELPWRQRRGLGEFLAQYDIHKSL